MKNKITVLIIDDSAVMRKLLRETLSYDKDIEVVGTALDPYIARDKIKRLNPDVLTLDIEMPRMDGISFLRNLMRLRPMPVVMVSSKIDEKAGESKALSSGAVDYMHKPDIDNNENYISYRDELIRKVKQAAKTKVRSDTDAACQCCVYNMSKKTKNNKLKHSATNTIIAIGASAGGTEAIKELLKSMPADSPAIIISQHIPKAFSTGFAESLDGVTAMKVYEAVEGQIIKQGCAYVAPGDQHLKLEKKGGQYFCHLDDGELVNRHKPSVDVMFESVANTAGKKALGVILTGMGYDGAYGLKTMREGGATTIAQDKNSSAVWGMPGEAVKLNAVDYTLPLKSIAGKLIELTK